MNKQRFVSVLKVVATILIVVFSIYFSIREVDFEQLGKSFQTANYWLALLAVPIAFLSHYIRAMRWKVILRHIHPEITTAKLFSGVMVGYFMNNIIPRSGEIAKPYVSSQGEAKGAFSSLLGSVIVERFVDVIALLLLAAGVLFFDEHVFDGFEDIGLSRNVIQLWLYPAIVIGVVFLLIAPSKLGSKIAAVLTKPLPDKIGSKILEIFTKLQKGFGCLKTWDQIALVAFETIVIYACYMLPLYIMFFAFPDAGEVDATILDAVKMLVITAAAMAVAPTPGGFGVHHYAAKVASMKMLAFPQAAAVAYGTITHFVQYVVVMLIGGYFLMKGNLSVSELKKAND